MLSLNTNEYIILGGNIEGECMEEVKVSTNKFGNFRSLIEEEQNINPDFECKGN